MAVRLGAVDKTFGLLLEPIRHNAVKGFNGTIFRRTREQIRNTGALWDSALELFAPLEANMRENALEIKFNEMKLKFSHLEYEKDKYNWDGAQICYLGFDELQLLTETQFWYLVGRNRSTCGVAPYIRATCMADAGSWVKAMIIWWLDENGEYPDIKKCGKVRWFIRIDDDIKWADTRKELLDRYPQHTGSGKCIPMSFTFIYSDVTENKILMEKDPAYMAKLNALPLIERERKLKGNWKIKPQAGLFFKREYFEIVEAPPASVISRVRAWDRAATEKTAKNDPASTAGVKMSKDAEGFIYIEHVSKFQASVFKRDKMINNIASGDGKDVRIGLEQEPGASGVAEVQGLIRMLSGYKVKAYSPRDNKMVRMMPFSAQAEAGNVKIVRGAWNDAYLTELENCDGNPKGKTRWDQIDGSSLGFEMLTGTNVVIGNFNVPSPETEKERGAEKIDTDFRSEFGKDRDRLI